MEKAELKMPMYWYHCESESIGAFNSQDELDKFDGTFGGEEVQLLDEAEYRRVASELGIDTRKDHNNFYDNLEYAQAGEEEVAELLSRKFKDFNLKSFNEDKDCDIVADIDGREVTIEVKEDVRTKDTGNVVIECESRGKPSGIMTTNADFWVFRVHTNEGIRNLLFKIKDLKQAIRDRRFHNKRQMPHTDSKNVLYFFRIDTLEEYATMEL